MKQRRRRGIGLTPQRLGTLRRLVVALTIAAVPIVAGAAPTATAGPRGHLTQAQGFALYHEAISQLARTAHFEMVDTTDEYAGTLEGGTTYRVRHDAPKSVAVNDTIRAASGSVSHDWYHLSETGVEAGQTVDLLIGGFPPLRGSATVMAGQRASRADPPTLLLVGTGTGIPPSCQPKDLHRCGGRFGGFVLQYVAELWINRASHLPLSYDALATQLFPRGVTIHQHVSISYTR